MNAYVRLTITDTLGVLGDDVHAFSPLSKVTRTFWYRLPDSWISGSRLVPDRREEILERLYRQGQGDRSRYVILEIQERVLSASEAQDKPWLGDRAAFYAWRDGDLVEDIMPANL